MQRVDLTKQFASRLRASLIDAGLGSTRSATGVDLQKFSQLIGHSTQICRKYLHGQAIPEPTKLSYLAEELGISPGWLLFGDCHAKQSLETNKLTISKPLLHYLFNHADKLYMSITNKPTLSDYLIEIINNISQMNIDEEQSKKIIDLAFNSIKFLQKNDYNPTDISPNQRLDL